MPVGARRLPAHDTFGNIPGVPVGTFWASRQECSRSRVHAPLVAGISGTKEHGAYSIVLSGVSGYEDDVDEGDRIIYTGSGGRAKGDQSRTGPQVQDQSFSDPRNAALLKSRETGNPVRVVRGAELRSDFAPPGGDCKYRYDGLYTVTNAWPERGRSGHSICRFELQRLPDQPPIPLRGRALAVRTARRRRERDYSPIPEPKFEGTPIPQPQAAAGASAQGSNAGSSAAAAAAPTLPADRTEARARIDGTSLTALRLPDSAAGPSAAHPPSSAGALRQARPPPAGVPSGSSGQRERGVSPRQADASASASAVPARSGPRPSTHYRGRGAITDLRHLKFTRKTDS